MYNLIVHLIYMLFILVNCHKMYTYVLFLLNICHWSVFVRIIYIILHIIHNIYKTNNELINNAFPVFMESESNNFIVQGQ